MSGSVVELNSKVLVRDERNKKQIVRQRIETLLDRKKNSRPTITHNSRLTPTSDPNF